MVPAIGCTEFSLGTAALLGVKRTTLYSRMQKLGISRNRGSQPILTFCTGGIREPPFGLARCECRGELRYDIAHDMISVGSENRGGHRHDRGGHAQPRRCIGRDSSRSTSRKSGFAASVPLAMEYEAVCLRPEHQIAAGLSEQEVHIFVDTVIAMAEPVKINFLWRPQLRDPSDEMVLETAVNGRADLLVTFNERDYGTVPERFGIQVMTPRRAMERIGK